MRLYPEPCMTCCVALLLLVGCNTVFSLDRTVPVGDPLPDAACAITVNIPSTADAHLISPNDQSLGARPALYLSFGRGGTGPEHRGIWSFDLAAVPADRRSIMAMRLRLPYLPNDDDCGSSCGSCADFEEAGVFELYALTSFWTEYQVSWIYRDKQLGTVWTFPGAGGEDRGRLLGKATHVPMQEVVFEIERDSVIEAFAKESFGRLSFLVKAESTGAMTGARMMVPASPPRASCSPPPVVSLDVTYCP